MKARIIGLQKGSYINKQGSEVQSTTIFFEEDFEEWEKDNAILCTGCKCGSEFVPANVDTSHLVIGGEYELIYSKGFGGKARLSKIVEVKK